ncbi:MAG TPA: hypothetical protein VF457_04190, partial [Burkholderiaceae bacterium]
AVARARRGRRAGAGALSPCDAPEGILREDLSREGRPECLAIFGHDNLRSVVHRRDRAMAAWVAANADIDGSVPAVEFDYMKRAQASFGAIRLFLPTGAFPGDDDARTWAQGLRDALDPFFEGTQAEARLPPLPVAGQAF